MKKRDYKVIGCIGAISILVIIMSLITFRFYNKYSDYEKTIEAYGVDLNRKV